jgi:hypothetical protein
LYAKGQPKSEKQKRRQIKGIMDPSGVPKGGYLSMWKTKYAGPRKRRR